jgi:hypothetical protein
LKKLVNEEIYSVSKSSVYTYSSISEVVEDLVDNFYKHRFNKHPFNKIGDEMAEKILNDTVCFFDSSSFC